MGRVVDLICLVSRCVPSPVSHSARAQYAFPMCSNSRPRHSPIYSPSVRSFHISAFPPAPQVALRGEPDKKGKVTEVKLTINALVDEYKDRFCMILPGEARCIV
eukprot:484983-Pyramimonas_sp.AAC.1